eukprot:CAMPEP_0202867328 /NCGR_PEP_ID=MMETSP1391-20130828/9204_1 /ASSEMBLY_ACC=CAM_ASM_000867 /TAXON_ID=1034604 /ORGANISM="Chlamydomonas leiostraca, Strain SAG 11-49" /LENGTH=69 /DNA_ID=CAMNT_0049547365 /DNA_START=557 /DNA_END=766 /DNA_ORIENTATION=+
MHLYLVAIGTGACMAGDPMTTPPEAPMGWPAPQRMSISRASWHNAHGEQHQVSMKSSNSEPWIPNLRRM